MLLGEYSFSQQCLNKIFNIPNNAMHTILPTDSGYILGLRNGNGICLVDFQANIEWIKTFYDMSGTWGSCTGCSSPNALINTNHNTYITSGVMQNGGPTANKVFSVKYSNTFDTLYLKLLLQDTITTNNYINNSFVNNTGNYIFLGHSSNSALIIKTDSNSNFLDSSLILKGNEVSWFNAGLQMGNYYYLFGGTYCYSPVQVTGFDREDGWVVKTDLLGNEILSSALGNPNFTDLNFKYVLPYKNNKLITGHLYSYAKDGNGYTLSRPWLVVLDENLNIYKNILLKGAFTSGDSLISYAFVNVIYSKDSSLLALGYRASFNTSTYESYKKANVVKFNDCFQIQFYREYKYTNVNYNNPFMISKTNDNGFILGGSVTDFTLTPPQQSWLVKTDSLGCDGLQSCNDTALVCEILQAPDTACKNDTAWLQVRFKGRSAPYFVYANTTLALDSVYYPYTLPLWIDTLVPYYPTTTGMQQVIIKVTDPWGWYYKDTVEVYVKNCGAGNIEEAWYPKKIEIYPNPATTELHVKIRTTITTPVIITIYDMQGKTLKQIISKQSENVIDIGELQQGVYWVKVSGNNLNVSERFAKL